MGEFEQSLDILAEKRRDLENSLKRLDAYHLDAGTLFNGKGSNSDEQDKAN